MRELRLDRGHSQAEFARRLGISPAYLNLIEKGRRTVQLPLLWKALELLQVEPEPFISSLGEQRVEESLAQLLDEPLLRTLNLDREDLTTLSAEPRAVTTITALFNLYKNTRSQLDNLLQHLGEQEVEARAAQRGEGPGEVKAASGGLRFDYSPLDEVVDFLQDHTNYFPSLEAESARVRSDAKLGHRVLSEQLVGVLENLGVRVVELGSGEGDAAEYRGSVVRRYDAARGELQLSSELSESRRKFDLSHVIGLRLLDELGLHQDVLSSHEPRHAETHKLIKIHLANYFAGAMLMPYGDFFDAVQRTRYDVERIAARFDVGYEGAAHRMTNLADPRRRAVPMHFLRVDIGGNISKRYSATGLDFPTTLGSCPKWVVHTAFLTPSILSKQYSLLPDGSAYFCFAKVMTAPLQGSLVKGTVYSIGLGVQAEDSRHLAYADDHPRWARERAPKISVPVGVTCRFCERTDCNQRAAPSYKFAFSPDEYVKKDNFFSPILGSDAQPEKRRRK